VLPGPEAAEEYGTLLEAVTTLAYLGGRTRTIRLGASVIVVPMRNAVVLARELATIDVLTRGRLIAGVGVGWSEEEFRNVGTADRFRTRGAFTDETIAVWRHLWSGSSQPFEGRFHRFSDHAFLPLPARGGTLPVLSAGAAKARSAGPRGSVTATTRAAAAPRSSRCDCRSSARRRPPRGDRCRRSRRASV
jgi:alkanesulfonate monooxygenase SsuD/methylene tetrahydromethanopterin reductase-like flavin-dependent oxidoreductase (luciferase family)